jgi:phosphatidate cytidylyltransferase
MQSHNIFGHEFKFTDVQLHLFFITLFCTIIAPFGGFLVFGLKRALRKQSSGVAFPLGSVIERIDCLIVAGFFLLIYMNSIVYKDETTFSHVKTMISNLSPDMKLQLLERMKTLEGISI